MNRIVDRTGMKRPLEDGGEESTSAAKKPALLAPLQEVGNTTVQSE